MSDSLRAFDHEITRYLNGQSTTTALLAACSRYLEASADWLEVRDVLRDDLHMSKEACLDWFAQQDFSDFAEAVEEGWGWND